MHTKKTQKGFPNIVEIMIITEISEFHARSQPHLQIPANFSLRQPRFNYVREDNVASKIRRCPELAVLRRRSGVLEITSDPGSMLWKSWWYSAAIASTV